jgi:hypothetical protein
VVVEPLAELIELLKDDFQVGVHHTERSLPACEVIVGGGISAIQGGEGK